MVMLTDLADVLRAAGLRVVEVPGWKTRGRPAYTGGFNPRGNLWHHTGAKDTNPHSIKDDRAYAERLAEIGRSDLPAPLCQLSVGRDGTIYVCAAGRGNHAGRARAAGPVPAGDGNELYLGWECQNTGTEGWSRAQYDAMVIGGAATSHHYGWTAAANRGHRETSLTGKWDPGALDLDQFRTDIRTRIEEDDMPSAEEIAKETVRELRNSEFDTVRAGKVRKTPYKHIYRELEEGQDHNAESFNKRFDAVNERLDGIESLLTQLIEKKES